jgi:transcription elongation factor Elf1
MKVNCPMCNTTYDMTSKIPSDSKSTIVCVVCETQLEVMPRGALHLYQPLITVRTKKD